MKGRVYLVGAGPGDPDLLTVKALRVLEQAQVILYDRLVDPRILARANPSAEILYVGKRAGEQQRVQERIFHMLAYYASSGKTVVRLKGGDPLVFGRGAEEWEYLREHHVDVELVPGVTSATSVAGLAGIPLTCRGVSHGFAVVTGVCLEGLIQDWTRYARVDTLVVLMASRQRRFIAQALIDAGRDPAEPAAFIENGSIRDERVIESTLARIASGEVEAGHPALLVVGEVVRLHARLMASRGNVEGVAEWFSL